ncbi:MAG: PilZ domain-containing protein [Leptospirales bacterium]|nr:PilZ domain-containing protein [Leptospirales bacterium]
MIEKRQDSRRKVLESPCSVILANHRLRATLLDVSRTGCRVELREPARLSPGVSVDVSFSLDEEPVLITGYVINTTDRQIGVSTLACSDSSERAIVAALRGEHLAGTRKPPIHPPSPRNVLALGAGGGKILGQLKMLETLETFLGKTLLSHFDMFAGCSSGALILALIANGRSIAEIRELVTANIKGFSIPGLFIFSNLLNKTEFHRGIDRNFGDARFGDLQRPMFTLSRNFKSSIHRHYATWSEGSLPVASILKRATAIPVLMGTHENEMDGGSGLFINPVEMFLRVLRHSESIKDDLNVLYVDSGFDPLLRPESISGIDGNVISQLFWIIGAMQRDLNILATDRIVNEFPGVRYSPYFFTYSRSYDLSKQKDFYAAEADAQSHSVAFTDWLRENYQTSMTT